MRLDKTRRWSHLSTYAALATVALCSSPANAEDTRFFINLGIGNVTYQPTREIRTIAGTVPGATASVSAHESVVLDSGIFITDKWSMAVSGGFPPTISIRGEGSIAALGELGTATYGSAILLAQRHFPIKRVATLYVGAGPVYSVIFSTKGTAASSIKLSDEFGFALQAGSTFPISRHYGIFVDVKKTFIRSKSEIVIGPDRFTSVSHPSPLTIAAGISYRF